MAISSCSRSEQEEIVATRQLHILLLPHELGDMGYGDAILRGVQTIRRDAPDLEVRIHQPKSTEEGEEIFYKWATSENNSQPSLFVVTSNEYKDALCEYFEENSLSQGKDILLFESKNSSDLPIYNFTTTTYGASYIAGIVASKCSKKPPLLLWGCMWDNSIYCALDGFTHGYISRSDSVDVDQYILSDDWTGYAMANEVYAMMSEWVEEFGFIYPIAGGSNHGIYRYLREYPTNTYTAGYDTDCSHLSTNVIGSTLKHIDKLIVAYISEWLTSGTMPEECIYGLASGYVDWVVAPDYEATYGDLVESVREEAIQMENIYEGYI